MALYYSLTYKCVFKTLFHGSAWTDDCGVALLVGSLATVSASEAFVMDISGLRPKSYCVAQGQQRLSAGPARLLPRRQRDNQYTSITVFHARKVQMAHVVAV